MGEKIISRLEIIIKDISKNNEPGHDYNHILRVRKIAKEIGEKVNGDLFLVDLLALVHDVEDHKLESNKSVNDILTSLGVDKDIIDKVISIIPFMSYFKNPHADIDLPLEGKIVIDADRIDASGAIGVARAFSYGGSHNRSFLETLKHFDEKLLLLEDSLYLDQSKKIIKERNEFLEKFYIEIKKEL